MEVVKLLPVAKSYIWGGNYFRAFGKKCDGDCISELWELSLRDNNSSIIASGEHENEEAIKVITNNEIGPVAASFPYFPLLIKLIDAKDNLSVQVHPSDDYALKNENSFGKSEMWHILSADEGCGLYVGLNDNYSKNDIENSLKDGSILNKLNFFKVKPGDTFIINPGTIHAIGKGVRLIEIQQNSDLTYRLYDYNRVGKDGQPRELHIEKALKVIDYRKYAPTQTGSEILADNQYFTVERIDVDGERVIEANGDSFKSFTIISQKAQINDIDGNTFDTFFLPYGKKCIVKGQCSIVVSSVRKK